MSTGHPWTVTRDEEAYEGAAQDHPPRVLIDQHGHYWRDYGTHLSMPPISDENSETHAVATYHLDDLAAAWAEVQAVRPPGWVVTLYDQGEHGPFNPGPDQPFGTPRYQAFSKLGILSSPDKHVGADEDSPAQALRNLAAAIAQNPDERPQEGQIVVGWQRRYFGRRGTLAEWLPVITYCAEETRRQYVYETDSRVRQRGLLATGWLLDAWAWAMAQAGPLTVDLIREIGKRVEPLDNEHGFRRIPIFVGGDEKARAEDIERLLGQLVDAYNEGRLDPVTHPGKTPQDQFYFEYENIHPFRDGNGRSGKVLYNMLRGTLATPEWPPAYFEGINP